MDEERHEVYERVPWETLERQAGDRRWLAYAVAGAVVLGALAYTFVQNGSAPPLMATTIPAAAQPAPPPVVPIAPPTTTVPVGLAEADLFAVHPERLVDQATAHAEWFAVEFFGFDGSEESDAAVAALLPEGLPKPQAPDGVQVFVDWVGATSVVELSQLRYEVAVAVRSLRSDAEGTFVRQPTQLATIEVGIGEDGRARVLAPPIISTIDEGTPSTLQLDAVPDDVRASLEASVGPVLGGMADGHGGWRVVVLVTGIDGVVRPTTVSAP